MVDCGLICSKVRGYMQNYWDYPEILNYFHVKNLVDSVHGLWTMAHGRSMVDRTMVRLGSSPETELVAGSRFKTSSRVRGNGEVLKGVLTVGYFERRGDGVGRVMVSSGWRWWSSMR
jgi:hypothetical protein